MKIKTNIYLVLITKEKYKITIYLQYISSQKRNL